ncbi:MAG: hypothetical protein ABIX01_02540 [Chitinophagaceae bacterium]
MIWIVFGGVVALLFGMYKLGPGSNRNDVNKQRQRQDQLKQAMEKYKHKKR